MCNYDKLKYLINSYPMKKMDGDKNTFYITGISLMNEKHDGHELKSEHSKLSDKTLFVLLV